jgi:hypothetical protein
MTGRWCARKSAIDHRMIDGFDSVCHMQDGCFVGAADAAH